MNAIALISTLIVTIIALLLMQPKVVKPQIEDREPVKKRKKKKQAKLKDEIVSPNQSRGNSNVDLAESSVNESTLNSNLSVVSSSEDIKDDGWIEVKKKKKGSDPNLSLSQGITSTDLTKKQRENQKKSLRIKEIKEIQRLEQEERLRLHRLSQSK